MTPFLNPATAPQQRYNHSLEQTRVKVENTFGRLKNRWGGLLLGLCCSPARAARVTTACAILHNIAQEQGDGGDDFMHQQQQPQLGAVPAQGDDVRTGRARRDQIVNTFFN